eukprot:8191098-Pyramimonas_sp.AAC.1
MGMGRTMMRKKAGKATAVGDPTVEIDHDGVVNKEETGWKAKGPEKWASFQAARPYSLKDYTVKAPKAGDLAPDGTVHSLKAGGTSSTLLSTVRELAAAKGKDDIAVIFGCSTCPAFRVFGGYDFHTAFAKKGFPILYVYTREAHGHDDFESDMNIASPFALAKTINMHKNLEERRAAAVLLHAHTVTQHGGKPVDMVMDDMTDSLEEKYEARPFRAYVISARSGQVKYASGVCPFNMQAKMLNISKL